MQERISQVMDKSLCMCVLQLGDWVMEKMLTARARDSTCDDTQQLHKKWLKHQTFMAELAQNKEWLDKIQTVRTVCVCV